MNGILDEEIAVSILSNVSAGLAVFGSNDHIMRWRNASFRKQTWFGGAFGGKSATKVTLFDLFDEKDHQAVIELFNIAVSMGQSYDFQRMVRRGPVGSFPAELRFHKIGMAQDDATLICLEISDLSLNKLYDELQAAHGQVRERLADLMAAQAELQYSVRMNTISEFGADLAHYLINPVTMCRDILDTHIVPALRENAAASEMLHALRYLKDIENFAVWFRKFSNPRMSETQICRVQGVIDDTLSLNLHRFSKQGITTRIRCEEKFNPFVLAVPVDLIMWLNASFNELSAVVPSQGGVIAVDVLDRGESVLLSVSALVSPGAYERVSTASLEKLTKRLPGSVKLESQLSNEVVSFSLLMAMFTEGENDESAQQPQLSLSVMTGEDVSSTAPVSAVEAPKGGGPLVLIVDDERDIRKLLKRQLKNLGMEVVEAGDGVEALEIFSQAENRPVAERIRAIVSDIRMPRMTGPHLLVALRDADVQLPFIFFSSNLVDQRQQQGDGFKYQSVHYLTKESGLEKLKGVLQKIMSSEGGISEEA